MVIIRIIDRKLPDFYHAVWHLVNEENLLSQIPTRHSKTKLVTERLENLGLRIKAESFYLHSCTENWLIDLRLNIPPKAKVIWKCNLGL